MATPAKPIPTDEQMYSAASFIIDPRCRGSACKKIHEEIEKKLVEFKEDLHGSQRIRIYPSSDNDGKYKLSIKSRWAGKNVPPHVFDISAEDIIQLADESYRISEEENYICERLVPRIFRFPPVMSEEGWSLTAHSNQEQLRQTTIEQLGLTEETVYIRGSNIIIDRGALQSKIRTLQEQSYERQSDRADSKERADSKKSEKTSTSPRSKK